MNNNLIGIEYNKEHNYRIYHSPLVQQHQAEFVFQSKFAHELYCERFKNTDTTWGYKDYNIFGLTVGSSHFYTLYKQIAAVCRDWVQNDEPMWLQAWINFHQPDDVLKWHNHADGTLHGYISIDPKNTSTRFEHFTIKNEIGKIYIGPCGLWHEVIVHETFLTPRITLAFQATTALHFKAVTAHWSKADWSNLHINSQLL